MSSQTRYSQIDDNVRRANDRHRHWVPCLVVGFLLAIAYLWTEWMALFPPPAMEWLSQHPVLGKIFSDDGHLVTQSWMHRSSDVSDHGQRRLLLFLTAIGFLLVYYLPLQFKKQPLVILTCLAVWWLLGVAALALFLGWHVLAYLTFHAPSPRNRWLAVYLALLATAAWTPHALANADTPLASLLKVAITLPLSYVLYAYVYYPLLQGRARAWLQPGIAHSSLIYVAIGVGWTSLNEVDAFLQPIGWLLFFWQWERVVMYHIDLKDGRVPADLPLFQYLATFLTPATFSNFHWLSRIPLGYAYLNNAFFARDKNQIFLSGVWLIVLSVFFFCIRPLVLKLFRLGMDALDLGHLTRYGDVVDVMRAGVVPEVGAMWCVLIYSFLSFYLLWTAVAHLKVGLWRLFGYDIEPYFQKPFLATNLVELWKRYSYYYREFLVQAFYYPVFLRCFRKSPRLRIFVATLAAAGFGNLVYHLMYSCLYYGTTMEIVAREMRTVPYYLLLGVGIAATQVYLVARGRKRRRPWTGGWKTGLDILAVMGTFGFFILIRPFHHVPLDESIMDALHLVLAAVGIR